MKKTFICAVLFGLCCFVPSFAEEGDISYNNENGELYHYETTNKECKKIKRTHNLVKGCDSGDVGKRYCGAEEKMLRAHNSKAVEATCILAKKDKNSEAEYTCAATRCSNDNMLWVGYDKYSKKWVSMGVCHSNLICDDHCGNCPDKGECIPVLDVPGQESDFDTGTEHGAYNKCMCAVKSSDIKIPETPPKQEDCPGGSKWNPNTQRCECQIHITGEIQYICPNGDITGDSHSNVTITLKEDEKIPIAADADKSCKELNDILSKASAGALRDIAYLDKLCAILTGFHGKNTKTGSASYSLDKWIASLDRSKWKDASGNFNTARLASDLTAGVVLGTVGGVVSGVVIKKKQVEKGFDALGCYVGGQKMSNWGDLFKIDFHK